MSFDIVSPRSHIFIQAWAWYVVDDNESTQCIDKLYELFSPICWPRSQAQVGRRVNVGPTWACNLGMHLLSVGFQSCALSVYHLKEHITKLLVVNELITYNSIYHNEKSKNIFHVVDSFYMLYLAFSLIIFSSSNSASLDIWWKCIWFLNLYIKIMVAVDCWNVGDTCLGF